jgi:hypothetical protein
VVKKRILIGLVLAGAGGLAGAIVLLNSPSAQYDAPPVAKAVLPNNAASDAQRFATLPAREAIGPSRGEVFGARSWAQAASVAATLPVAPPKPVAPPVPYRVAGQVTHGGVVHVVLARDDRVLTVREGDRLDDVYRVESIKPDVVTLVYLPLDMREELPVAGLLLETQLPPVAALNAAVKDVPSAAGESRPAQLRWQGPQRVQAGNNFDVALKLTSAEPVRSVPVQLSFDSKLLEPVSVRPGDLFAEGRFTYRINPGGSIFVGANGNGAAPADAEFLVVTFRPLRSGDAVLKLSSVALQGAAGRAIAHEPPAAFHTAIVQ